MSVVAQNIIAFGVAALLVMYGLAGLVWSLRCSRTGPHYRLPTLFALTIPAGVYLLINGWH
jgi:hypothetical protein